MRAEMQERKKPTSPVTISQYNGNGEYIVGTEIELTSEVWNQLLKGFGSYHLEMIIKNKPTYIIQFTSDPGLEKLKLQMKLNPQIRYVEANAKLEKKTKTD
ncbi:hypothetical protein [Leptospira bandrabouensis]|nr:hypothetical protein [Leptospira bandrabouensis]MCG6153738.1 hypothetical protein [Leptospira bandrabouensis]